MSQHSLSIANESGSAFRGDVNSALQALASNSSGASAPATTYPFQQWADTTNNVLKRRNAANAAWIVRDTISETFVVSRSSNTILDQKDFGKFFEFTASFTQTVTAAATLGDDWAVDCHIDSGVTIVFDPNGAETIDGAPTKSVTGPTGGRIACNGSSFFTTGFAIAAQTVGATAVGKNIAARTDATTPNSKINITADEVELKDANGVGKVFSSVSVTGDMAVSGAGGLDTGAEAGSTWYYGWLVGKDDGTISALISTSSSAPTMPGGYTYKGLISAVRNDGSSNFVKYRQQGNRVSFETYQNVLSGGTATTETAVSCSAVVPPIAARFTIDVPVISLTADGGGDFKTQLIVRYITASDFCVINRQGRVGTSANSRNDGKTVELPNVSQQFFYLHAVTFGSSPSADIYVQGFQLPGGGE